MKLRALELVRFGGVQDKILSLAADRPFHVAYAPNEAGKSTMRRGLLALLFGIGAQDRDASVFQSDTKVAGRFETAEGLLRLTRHKRVKAPLVTNEAGQDWGPQIEQLQLGRSRETYARTFALDHVGLAAFAHSLAHEGPLAALATAELGGLDVGAMQRALDEAATKLAADTATRSKKKEIALAVEEMRRVDAELLAATVSPAQVATAQQARAAAEARLTALRSDERALDQEVWRAEQRVQLSGEARELERQLQSLSAMAPSSRVSEEQLSHARAQAQNHTRARDTFDRISAERTQLEMRIHAMPAQDTATLVSARAIASRHVEIDALFQGAERLSELQISLREAHATEASLRLEQQSLGLDGSPPIAEGWVLHVARWRESVAQLARHRGDVASRQEGQPTTKESDLEAFEAALARAELATAPELLKAPAERLARAERECDELSRLSPASTISVDLPLMRQLRDAALRALIAKQVAAPPETIRTWLHDAAEVDVATDALIGSVTSGAHQAEALRAAFAAREHMRADMARLHVQRDESLNVLQEALRARSVIPPRETSALLQKGREIADQWRRALAKSHEDARRLTLWRQRDSELAAALAQHDDEAHSVWGVALGARLHGVADRVLGACEKHVQTARECARLEDAVRLACTELAQLAQNLPVPQPTPQQQGKIYLRQLAELRLKSAAQLVEAASYDEASASCILLEQSQRTAQELVVAAEAALTRCLQAQRVSHLKALEEARTQTRCYDDAHAHVEQRKAAIAAGAARIGLELADALVPSSLAEESLHSARIRRDETHGHVEAADLHLHATLRDLHHVQGHGTRAIELSEERAAIAAHLENLLARYVRLRSASTLLTHALREHRDAQLAPLLRCTSGYMSALSAGAYDTVVLDAHSDKPELQLRAGSGRSRTVEELSDGTRDQLGLATRLAYEELHGSPDALPLLLDDVLVHFDDERAACALRALSVFCIQRPVLLLTHHAHVVELARAHVPPELLDLTTLVSTV